MLDPAYKNIADEAEFLLFLADRSQHCASIVEPALGQGKVVICDRFESSTLAYQVYGTQFETERTRRAMELSRHGLVPDLVLIYDIDPIVGMRRKKGDMADRIEQKSLEYHQQVRSNYLRYTTEHDYAVAINAEVSPQEVHEQVIQAANQRLGLNLPVLEV